MSKIVESKTEDPLVLTRRGFLGVGAKTGAAALFASILLGENKKISLHSDEDHHPDDHSSTETTLEVHDEHEDSHEYQITDLNLKTAGFVAGVFGIEVTRCLLGNDFNLDTAGEMMIAEGARLAALYLSGNEDDKHIAEHEINHLMIDLAVVPALVLIADLTSHTEVNPENIFDTFKFSELFENGYDYSKRPSIYDKEGLEKYLKVVTDDYLNVVAQVTTLSQLFAPIGTTYTSTAIADSYSDMYLKISEAKNWTNAALNEHYNPKKQRIDKKREEAIDQGISELDSLISSEKGIDQKFNILNEIIQSLGVELDYSLDDKFEILKYYVKENENINNDISQRLIQEASIISDTNNHIKLGSKELLTEVDNDLAEISKELDIDFSSILNSNENFDKKCELLKELIEKDIDLTDEMRNSFLLKVEKIFTKFKEEDEKSINKLKIVENQLEGMSEELGIDFTNIVISSKDAKDIFNKRCEKVISLIKDSNSFLTIDNEKILKEAIANTNKDSKANYNFMLTLCANIQGSLGIGDPPEIFFLIKFFKDQKAILKSQCVGAALSEFNSNLLTSLFLYNTVNRNSVHPYKTKFFARNLKFYKNCQFKVLKNIIQISKPVNLRNTAKNYSDGGWKSPIENLDISEQFSIAFNDGRKLFKELKNKLLDGGSTDESLTDILIKYKEGKFRLSLRDYIKEKYDIFKNINTKLDQNIDPQDLHRLFESKEFTDLLTAFHNVKDSRSGLLNKLKEGSKDDFNKTFLSLHKAIDKLNGDIFNGFFDKLIEGNGSELEKDLIKSESREENIEPEEEIEDTTIKDKILSRLSSTLIEEELGQSPNETRFITSILAHKIFSAKQSDRKRKKEAGSELVSVFEQVFSAIKNNETDNEKASIQIDPKELESFKEYLKAYDEDSFNSSYVTEKFKKRFVKSFIKTLDIRNEELLQPILMDLEKTVDTFVEEFLNEHTEQGDPNFNFSSYSLVNGEKKLNLDLFIEELNISLEVSGYKFNSEYIESFVKDFQEKYSFDRLNGHYNSFKISIEKILNIKGSDRKFIDDIVEESLDRAFHLQVLIEHPAIIYSILDSLKDGITKFTKVSEDEDHTNDHGAPITSNGKIAAKRVNEILNKYLSHNAVEVDGALLTQIPAVPSLQTLANLFLPKFISDKSVKDMSDKEFEKLILATYSTIMVMSGFADNVAAFLFGYSTIPKFFEQRYGKDYKKLFPNLDADISIAALKISEAGGSISQVGNGANFSLNYREVEYELGTNKFIIKKKKLKLGETTAATNPYAALGNVTTLYLMNKMIKRTVLKLEKSDLAPKNQKNFNKAASEKKSVKSSNKENIKLANNNSSTDKKKAASVKENDKIALAH